MVRFINLSLVLFYSLSLCSTSIIEKSLKRRQVDAQYCQAIEGFDCKCSYYRVTCSTDRDLPSRINIIDNEKGKYQSVELVIMAQRDIHVNDRTFEPIKELFKFEVDNLEFRVKFEKFTALHLSSPGIFNRVFPETIPSTVRKHMALEIYNPEVPPQDHKNLFENLYTDSLELYTLYPFHGTFQELFNSANIKYLRLSGGDIRSDLYQTFTGNIGRLELAKQASSLSIQNFPVYPAHELIINAYYITDFQSEHPPNYNNLQELRVHSPERIPSNAFRQYPNIHILSISTDKDIDLQALNGLNQLEKLTIKDTLPSIDLINTVPTIRELELNIEKLDPSSQCILLEKLFNGQVAIQALPNSQECTCISAILDQASGRYPCDPLNCEQSSCSTIRNNYDVEKKKFKNLPSIFRNDGTDAFRPRDLKRYPGPYQVSHDDRIKLERAIPQQRTQEQEHQHEQNQPTDDSPSHSHSSSDNRPASIDDNQNDDDDYNQDSWKNDNDQIDEQKEQKSDDQSLTTISVQDEDFDWQEKPDENKNNQDETQNNDSKGDKKNGDDEDDIFNESKNNQKEDVEEETKENNDQSANAQPTDTNSDITDQATNDEANTENADADDDQPKSDDVNKPSDKQDHDESKDNNDETDKENKSSENDSDTKTNEDSSSKSDNQKAQTKKGFNWLPVILIIAALVGLFLLAIIFIIKRNKTHQPERVPTNDPEK